MTPNRGFSSASQRAPTHKPGNRSMRCAKTPQQNSKFAPEPDPNLVASPLYPLRCWLVQTAAQRSVHICLTSIACLYRRPSRRTKVLWCIAPASRRGTDKHTFHDIFTSPCRLPIQPQPNFAHRWTRTCASPQTGACRWQLDLYQPHPRLENSCMCAHRGTRTCASHQTGACG